MGAYNVSETYRGGEYRMQAAENVAKAIERWQEEKRKREYNEGVFEELAASNQLPVGAYERWAKANGNADKQAGILSSVMSQQQFEQQQQLIAQRQQEAASFTPEPMVIQDPLSGEKRTYVRTNRGQVVPWDAAGGGAGGRGSDSLDKLDKDVRDASGAPLSAWLNLPEEQKRIEGDYIVADAASALPGGSTGSKNKQLKMRREQFDSFGARYSALQGGGGAAAPQTSNVQRSTSNVEQGTVPAGTPRIGSEAEYNALASGAVYIDARDGKTKRKRQ